ncbi:MAG: DUF2147 domain-containing protein [Paludibacteraceae bacterium]|nr:DUF2147 domain-containing protein [Paludibacteraceae bacterium]
MRHLFLTLLLSASCLLQAQVSDILGDWLTVDDATGDNYAVVRIYQADNGKYYGRIIEMLFPNTEDMRCAACKEADHDQPILGMVIIRDMEAKGDCLTGGRVLDPNNGKFYHGRITCEKGRLCLRGSLDRAGLLGRNQYWKRR